MKDQTFLIMYKDGTYDVIYCKKDEIKHYMTVEQYEKYDHIEIMNRGDDKVQHKPIYIEIKRA